MIQISLNNYHDKIGFSRQKGNEMDSNQVFFIRVVC